MSNVVFKFHILETFLKFLFSYFRAEKFFIVKENYISGAQFTVLDIGELYLLIYGVESEVERIIIAKVVPGPLPVRGKLTLGTSQGWRDGYQGENQGDFVKPHLKLGQSF